MKERKTEGKTAPVEEKSLGMAKVEMMDVLLAQ